MKINLGCGRKILKGYTNVDKIDYGQEVIKNGYDYLLSLKGNSVDEVIAHHYLEHFTQDEVRDYLNELHRVLKPSGVFYAVVPHKDRDRAWILTHYTFYTEATFKNLEDKQQCEDYGFEQWKIERIVTNNRKDIHVWIKKV